MKEPATESAVHTTPPMMSAASMPPGPFSPTATITTEARMSVISVMPLTGFEPTMAMALAATVVKRKAMTATSRMPTTAKSRLSITPSQKKMNVTTSVTAVPMAMILNARSLSVRFSSPSLAFCSAAGAGFRRIMAPLMMGQLLMIPITPAIAMPPIPIDLPYALNICSGDMSPTAVVIEGSHWFSTSPGKSSAMPGTMIHHTAREPRQMMNAYFRPTM